MGLVAAVLLSFAVLGQPSIPPLDLSEDICSTAEFLFFQTWPDLKDGTYAHLDWNASLVDAKGKRIRWLGTDSQTASPEKSHPTAFAVEGIRLYSDSEGKHEVSHRVRAGQRVYYRLTLVGVARGKEDPPKSVGPNEGWDGPMWPSMQIVRRSIAGRARVVVSGEIRCLTQPGRFTLRFHYTDCFTSKSLTFEAPLEVVGP